MHTAVVCPNFYRRGGIERVAIAAAQGLSGCGHVITVAGSYIEPGVIPSGIDSLKISRPRLGSSGNIAFFGRNATNALRSIEQPDAVLGFGVTSPDDAVTWVQSVHARWLATAKHTEFRGRIKRLCNPFHRVAIFRERQLFGGRKYRRLLALTKDVADDLIQFYGVPAKDIDIVPNGVCCEEFKKFDTDQRDKWREQFGVKPDDKAICFVANESDRKGLPQLVEAVSRLAAPTLKLLIAGRVGSAVERLSREFEMGSRMKWLGQLEEIAPVFAASDLFVLPTAYEAWGLVIVESLACGTPVITTRLAGASESIIAGTNGYLLDNPSDLDLLTSRIKQAVIDDQWDRDVVVSSVQPYTWNGIIPKVAEILESSYQSRPWLGSVGKNEGFLTA